ncbi:hypothetical protein EX30DRAFT_15000 [Ascodesmis nigricans]|uniref:C2H2-type domain-containing protein n=1 Tax=Ascodesmis nigricans TaxID=341454 RepID=A0A4S2N6X0_9PEZI|nr:hypothetical protein EX30DRAFT_15000 [Ascodesmis nigricans]
MPDDQKSAYGSGVGEANFRRTWDRTEWAAKAKEREAAHRAESKARAEAAAAGKKYHAAVPDDAEMISARRDRINFTENLNKTTLVPVGAGVGKRGKSAGYYCETCDLTFKDSLQWVDHLNSKQHLAATGAKAEVKVATLEEVLERMAWLKRLKVEREKGLQMDLKERLEENARLEEEERRARREKRKETRRMKRTVQVKQEEKDDGPRDTNMGEEEDADAIAMARMMGFSGGFGTTKRD